MHTHRAHDLNSRLGMCAVYRGLPGKPICELRMSVTLFGVLSDLQSLNSILFGSSFHNVDTCRVQSVSERVMKRHI